LLPGQVSDPAARQDLSRGVVMDAVTRRESRLGRAASIGSCLVLAVAGQAWGGVGRWTALGGTPGGKVNVMAVDPAHPRRLLAATAAAGLFRSRNGGRTWDAVPGLPSHSRANVVVFDPRRPRIVVAGFAPAQAFKSVDGGDSWTPLAGGPFAGLLLSLTFAPGLPEIAYALSGDHVFASADGGATWQARGTYPGRYSFGMTPIVVSPFDADTLFIDAYLSTDGGRSWTFVSPNPLAADTDHRVLFDPLHPGVILYAAVNLGVFRSEDGGQTWNDVTPMHTTGVYYLEGMAFSWDGRRLFVAAGGVSLGATSYGSFFQESQDGGLHWTEPSALAPFQLGQVLEDSIVADPAGSERLYAATRWGVYWSADGGRSWESRTDGLVAGGVVDLVADSQLPGTLYAVSKTLGPEPLRSGYGALSRSLDGGVTWHFVRGEIQDRLTADPTRAGTFYSGLLRFTHEGERWRLLPFSFSKYCLSSSEMVVDPVAPSTLYLMTQSYTGYGCHLGDLGLFKSSDNGLSWEDLSSAPVIDHLAFGAPHHTLYGESYKGAASSHDGGKTWTDSNLGLPPLFEHESLALSRDSGWLYLSGRKFGQSRTSVFRSENGAMTWKRAAPSPLGTAAPFALVADPHVATVVYGFGGGRFFRSLDGGESWTEHSAGLRGLELTGPLLLDPRRPGRILAGTASGLVIEIELP
jgi:photosystem II stability/assembly factor-like uncharacterized protein